MKASNDRGYNFVSAVISDIHGNSWALEAVLKDIERRGIKNMMNLGDCLYGPLDPAGTADMLIPLNIPTVRGNEDRIVVETPGTGKPSPTLSYVRESLKPLHLQWLKSLPLTYLAYEDFLLFHGTPNKDDEYGLVDVSENGVSVKEPGELMAVLSSYPQQVFLCGHDHVPRAVYLPDGKMIIDPGSVGLPAYTDDLPFPHAMETYTPHARYSIIYRVEKGWQKEDIAVPYDWESAAGAAIKNNRPDWAKWLQTGFS
jgi:predicted phosphodiesterase